MADQQDSNQADKSPDKSTLPTAADLEALAEKERGSFMDPTQLSAKRQADTAAILEGRKPDASKADDGGAGADDDTKLTDDERAAKAVADGADDGKAEEGKKAEGEDGKAKGEEGGKGEQLPDWLKGRSDRVATKERAVETRERELADKERELEEREAALKAAPKLEPIKAPDKPKPADFDDVETYETARDKFDADLKTFNDETAKRAADAVKKSEPKKADDDKGTKAPALPAGISQADLNEATGNIANVLTKEQVADLGDSKKVPNLTAAVVIHLGAQGKDRTKDMADFIVKSPKTMAAIAALPAIKQGGAFERAFVERPKPKQTSAAPAPLNRLDGGAKVGTESYAEYEARRNAEDIAERMH